MAARLTPSHRLGFLDSLRGWAAIYVILYHTALMPTPALPVPAWAAPVILSGGTGVTLFFVASAFSLCRAARPGEDRGRALAAYAMRRFFRIVPLFYLVLAASVLRDSWLFSVGQAPATIAVNAALLFNLWPGHETGIAWASWTIGVEILFYAIFPFLVVRVTDVSRAAILLLGSLLVAAVFPVVLARTGLTPAELGVQAQYGLLHHLPVFAAGMLAYRVFERFEQTSPAPAVGIALLLAAAYLYASLLGGHLSHILLLDDYDWQAVVFTLAVLGLAIYPARLLVNRITRHMGRISYSLYLLHPFIVYALIPVYARLQHPGWPTTLRFGACATLTLACCTAAATLTCILVEEPCIRLGRRAEHQFTARRAPASAAGSIT